MWESAGYWLEEDLELSKTPMHLQAKGNSRYAVCRYQLIEIYKKP